MKVGEDGQVQENFFEESSNIINFSKKFWCPYNQYLTKFWKITILLVQNPGIPKTTSLIHDFKTKGYVFFKEVNSDLFTPPPPFENSISKPKFSMIIWARIVFRVWKHISRHRRICFFSYHGYFGIPQAKNRKNPNELVSKSIPFFKYDIKKAVRCLVKAVDDFFQNWS